MKYYIFWVEMSAMVLFVIPKIGLNFIRHPKNNGALKIRIALLVMAIMKIGHLYGLITDTVTGWWSLGSTAAFISLFVFAERPTHDNRTTKEVPPTRKA